MERRGVHPEYTFSGIQGNHIRSAKFKDIFMGHHMFMNVNNKTSKAYVNRQRAPDSNSCRKRPASWWSGWRYSFNPWRLSMLQARTMPWQTGWAYTQGPVEEDAKQGGFPTDLQEVYHCGSVCHRLKLLNSQVCHKNKKPVCNRPRCLELQVPLKPALCILANSITIQAAITQASLMHVNLMYANILASKLLWDFAIRCNHVILCWGFPPR